MNLSEVIGKTLPQNKEDQNSSILIDEIQETITFTIAKNMEVIRIYGVKGLILNEDRLPVTYCLTACQHCYIKDTRNRNYTKDNSHLADVLYRISCDSVKNDRYYHGYVEYFMNNNMLGICIYAPEEHDAIHLTFEHNFDKCNYKEVFECSSEEHDKLSNCRVVFFKFKTHDNKQTLSPTGIVMNN